MKLGLRFEIDSEVSYYKAKITGISPNSLQYGVSTYAHGRGQQGSGSEREQN